MQHGYFDTPKREYVITNPKTPISWTNYLGLEDMCSVISHNGGGYSFYKSAEYGRITRFRPNSVPLDRPGHYVYLRDDDEKDYWSLSWQPVGKSLDKATYITKHGMSYTKFLCDYKGISAEQTVFIPLGDNVELWDVCIKNNSERVRNISAFSYCEFSLHEVQWDNINFQYSLYAGGSSYKDGIIDFKFVYNPGQHHYFCSSFEPDSFDCLRDSFIGIYNTESNPQAMIAGKCSNSQMLTGNHCGSLHKKLQLQPGEKIRLVFMLGVGSRKKVGIGIKKKYSNLTNVDIAFNKLKEYWNEKFSHYECNTPDDGLNTMTNIWTLYQAETCVTWSRFASFIEVGGRTGLGYRDTAQDVMSVLHSNPKRAKQRICELLTGQVAEGYALHIFDPLQLTPGEESAPPLTEVCSDDMLWLVVTICDYVKEQGDLSFFEEVFPFADHGKATVYEHLKRALLFSANHVGNSGICKGLKADWNDCINLGGGESSMVSFQHYWALQEFIQVAKILGKDNDVRMFNEIATQIKIACERELWDGEWFIRGFTADGKKIGTKDDSEGKIFLNAQSWAVLSGIAKPEHARNCMNSVKEHLSSDFGLHLLSPAYSTIDDNIGLVTYVYKGVKENAAIFSHPNPWAVIAETMLGNGDRAYEYYSNILPYNQNDKIEIRHAEPYSYCQFIYGREHEQLHGKANHPWLTGTAGWFYTAVTRWMLGVRVSFTGMEIDPCIPKHWDGFTVTRVWRGAKYLISVKNPNHICKGVKQITLNGKNITDHIPIQESGSCNKIEVVMG